jgi:hypothetical protein
MIEKMDPGHVLSSCVELALRVGLVIGERRWRRKGRTGEHRQR